VIENLEKMKTKRSNNWERVKVPSKEGRMGRGAQKREFLGSNMGVGRTFAVRKMGIRPNLWEGIKRGRGAPVRVDR